MPDETAMLLTQQEWDDLENMVAHYKLCTNWMTHEESRHKQQRRDPEHVRTIERQRKLADRIIKANEPAPIRRCMWAVEGECGPQGCEGCEHGGAGSPSSAV